MADAKWGQHRVNMKGRQDEKKTLGGVLKNKGNEYLGAGRALEALDLYNQAVVLDPSNHLIYSNRCAALTQLEEYQEALKDADRVLKLMPGWPMGYFRRGTALVYMQQYQLATETYQKGLALLPDNVQLREALDHCRHQMIIDEQQQHKQQQQQQQQQHNHPHSQKQHQQTEKPILQSNQNVEEDDDIEEDDEEVDVNSTSSLDDLCDELMLETEIEDISYNTSIADELALAKDRKESVCVEKKEDRIDKIGSSNMHSCNDDQENKSKHLKNIENQQMAKYETENHISTVLGDANKSTQKENSREIVRSGNSEITPDKEQTEVNSHNVTSKDDVEKNNDSNKKNGSKNDFEEETINTDGSALQSGVTLIDSNGNEQNIIYNTNKKEKEYKHYLKATDKLTLDSEKDLVDYQQEKSALQEDDIDSRQIKNAKEIENQREVDFDMNNQHTEDEIIIESIKTGNKESLKSISHKEFESNGMEIQTKEKIKEISYETDNESISIHEYNDDQSRQLRVRNAVGILAVPYKMVLLIYRMLVLVGDIVKLLFVSVYLTALNIWQLWKPPLKKSVLGDVVLVTGAGHGIGKELALQYAQLGAKVVCWDINQVNNNSTVREIKSSGGVAWGYKCDVSRREDVRASAQMVRDEIGEVTILVNNVGTMPCKPFLKHTPDDIENLYRTNVFAHFWTVREFLPSMIGSGHGHVVAMSSVGGMMGLSNVVPYCSTSFAVRGLMEGLVEELRYGGRNPNIKLTCVLPSVVDTGLVQNPRIRFPAITPIISPAEAAALVIQGQRLNFETVCIPPKYYYAHAVARLLPKNVRKSIRDFMNTGVDETAI
ncbi:unnamed protein product [Meganyctiphanes norvegica]|uniref:Short-chain dehydrogenase/reductase 3 n=1 Tax=Meganyctiphanes norvegica TaxID=48144 RepID=A0AAV2RFG0_MEGNR